MKKSNVSAEVYDFASSKGKVVIREDIPSMIKTDGKIYELSQMYYLADDIKRYRASLRKREVNYRSMKYRHPKDNVIARIFYVRN